MVAVIMLFDMQVHYTVVYAVRSSAVVMVQESILSILTSQQSS